MPQEKMSRLNTVYTGRLFHCYMLDESMSFLGCRVYLYAFLLFLIQNPVIKHVDPDHMPHYVASDLSLLCLPI